MRKLMILLLFCGCSGEISDSQQTSSDKIDVLHKGVWGQTKVTVYICKFKYEQHSYIRFSEGFGNEFTSSVIHDPDCDCQK